MSRLEIGYAAGSHSALDRRMEQIRAVVQQAARPYQLVTVPYGHIGAELPIIVDASIASSQLNELASLYLAGIMPRPWLWLRLSEYCGLAEVIASQLPLKVYRNAINTRPLVAAFLERIPHEIHIPKTITVTSSSRALPI